MYRIIIADDEVMERKVLEKMIRQSCPEAELLPSASNGIELVNGIETYAPDIAVIDINMPGFNGLDAMEIIRLKNLQTRFIVVSAYGKFEYAQKAITLGACDYLLKPVSEAKLAASIRKLTAQLQAEEEQQSNKKDMDRMVQTYRNVRENELMSALLLGELSREQLEAYLSERNRKFYAGCILCVQVPEAQRDKEKEIFEQFLEQMKRITDCLGKVYRHSLLVCAFAETDILEGTEETENWVRDLVVCVVSAMGTQGLRIGVSTCKYVPEELYDGIRESQSAYQEHDFEHTFVLPDTKSCELAFYTLSSDSGKGKSIRALFDRGREFLRLKDETGWRDLQRQMREAVKAGDFPVKELALYTALFLQQSVEKLIPAKRMELFGSREYSMLFSYSEQEAVLSDMERLISRLFFQTESDSCHRYVRKSLDYMEQHYMENLTLDQVAGENGISSFYLSRLFKQCLDNTFLNILTNIRLARALELLASENYTVQEISELAGYMNVSYFYKLIKKQTGLTVSEMKQLL